MCSMALMNQRSKRVVVVAPDPKTDAAGSVLDLVANPPLHHQTELVCGVLASSCGQLLHNSSSSGASSVARCVLRLSCPSVQSRRNARPFPRATCWS
jgi:hypothetical protein